MEEQSREGRGPGPGERRPGRGRLGQGRGPGQGRSPLVGGGPCADWPSSGPSGCHPAATASSLASLPWPCPSLESCLQLLEAAITFAPALNRVPGLSPLPPHLPHLHPRSLPTCLNPEPPLTDSSLSPSAPPLPRLGSFPLRFCTRTFLPGMLFS